MQVQFATRPRIFFQAWGPVHQLQVLTRKGAHQVQILTKRKLQVQVGTCKLELCQVHQVKVHVLTNRNLTSTINSKINGTHKGVYLPISKLHSILAATAKIWGITQVLNISTLSQFESKYKYRYPKPVFSMICHD